MRGGRAFAQGVAKLFPFRTTRKNKKKQAARRLTARATLAQTNALAACAQSGVGA